MGLRVTPFGLELVRQSPASVQGKEHRAGAGAWGVCGKEELFVKFNRVAYVCIHNVSFYLTFKI